MHGRPRPTAISRNILVDTSPRKNQGGARAAHALGALHGQRGAGLRYHLAEEEEVGVVTSGAEKKKGRGVTRKLGW